MGANNASGVKYLTVRQQAMWCDTANALICRYTTVTSQF